MKKLVILDFQKISKLFTPAQSSATTSVITNESVWSPK